MQSRIEIRGNQITIYCLPECHVDFIPITPGVIPPIKTIEPPKPKTVTSPKTKEKTAKAHRKSFRYTKLKTLCKEKKVYECWNCGGKHELTMHHIKSMEQCIKEGNPEQIYDLDNIVWLCVECHNQFHKDNR